MSFQKSLYIHLIRIKLKKKNRIKLHLLFNTSLKAVIIGKGSFHINKDNITSKIFNKIMKITLSKKKIGRNWN